MSNLFDILSSTQTSGLTAATTDSSERDEAYDEKLFDALKQFTIPKKKKACKGKFNFQHDLHVQVIW